MKYSKRQLYLLAWHLSVAFHAWAKNLSLAETANCLNWTDDYERFKVQQDPDMGLEPVFFKMAEACIGLMGFEPGDFSLTAEGYAIGGEEGDGGTSPASQSLADFLLKANEKGN